MWRFVECFVAVTHQVFEMAKHYDDDEAEEVDEEEAELEEVEEEEEPEEEEEEEEEERGRKRKYKVCSVMQTLFLHMILFICDI